MAKPSDSPSQPNGVNSNLISEEDFFDQLNAGAVHEVASSVVLGSPPPQSDTSTIPMLSGSLPLGMQLPTDLIRTSPRGTPSQRLWPLAPAGVAGTNSAVTSGTRGISVVANQANKTATSANTTAKTASAAVTVVSSTPVLQTTGVGGAIQSKPLIGGSPIAVTQDALVDGLSFVRLLATHASGNVAYNFKGNWSSVTSYIIGDEVFYQGIYWLAIVASLNSAPVFGNANWQQVGLNAVSQTDLLAQTASLGLTTAFTTSGAGFYLILAFYIVSQPSTGISTLSIKIAGVTGPTATATTSGAGSASLVTTTFLGAAAPVDFTTTFSGSGGSTYDLHIRALGPF